MANIANFNPSKVTTGRLKPELQSIFDELPVLIDYCERNGQILSEQIIEEIKDEINLTPERREQVIITHRDKFAERYKELINSGLRLKATDKDDILETIGLLMYAKGTWELPMPKDCGFESIKPDPKGYFHAMIAPVFNNYAFIQACNVLLSHTDDNGTQPEGLSVDDILNNMFTLTSLELENLKNNLTKNDKQYISLNYIGTKKSLWEDLGKLLSAGIDRNEISRVFSEYCYWQKSTAGKSNKLEYDEIYKKIGRKVTK